jgi:hypothetical protein
VKLYKSLFLKGVIMWKKILAVGIFTGAFFGISYSMETDAGSSVSTRAPLSDIQRLVTEKCVGQCYGDLDTIIRGCTGVEKIAQVFDLVKKYSAEQGDVCMTYHRCRVAYDSIHAGAHPETVELERMQKRLIFILARVYIDAAASVIVANGSADIKHCEEIYNLFKSKVQAVWYPQIASYDANFSEVVKTVLEHVGSIMKNLPSPIWVYFCQWAKLSCLGVYPHTIYFGNIDTRYDYQYREHAKEIGDAKGKAFERIKTKLQEIAAGEKSNQEKWTEFLNLAYKDI